MAFPSRLVQVAVRQGNQTAPVARLTKLRRFFDDALPRKKKAPCAETTHGACPRLR